METAPSTEESGQALSGVRSEREGASPPHRDAGLDQCESTRREAGSAAEASCSKKR